MHPTEDSPGTHPNLEPGEQPSSRTPRWVKLFAIVAFAALLSFACLHLAGFHGGHNMSGDSHMNLKTP